MDIHGRPSNTMHSMVIHDHHFTGVVLIVSVQRSGFLSIYNVLSRFASVRHQHLLAVFGKILSRIVT